MVKLPIHYFEAIFGINAPWSVKNVDIDDENKLISLELGYAEEKSLFSFFSKSTTNNDEKITNTDLERRWVHASLGLYRCDIVSKYYVQQTSGAGFNRNSLMQLSFIGDAHRTYTHGLRQQIALANLHDMNPEAIAISLRIHREIVEAVLNDIDKTPENYRLATSLPIESDALWEDVIADRYQIKTQLFSLKLLLSKLRLSGLDRQNRAKLTESITELRKFFVFNTNSLDAEYAQICALHPKKEAAEEPRASTGGMKLVLPSLKNSIWIKIITGRIDLGSKNMPLNLFLVRLRHAFLNATDNNQKIMALNSLRDFIKKNARSLKPELILMNELMNAPEESKFSLPDERHQIWKRILKDDTYIPSSYMAYKLLLSNLRSQILMNPDPVVELNAMRRIRDFMKHNQQFMRQELQMVLRNTYSH